MISKINSAGSVNHSNFKRHLNNTVNGAVSGAILGAAVQGVVCGAKCIKYSKGMPLKDLKSLAPTMLKSIRNNAITCAALNAAIGLFYSIYNSHKSKN